MRNLLRADLRRMLRWRGFHGAVIAMALLPFVNFFLYSAFGSGFSLQELLFNGVAAIGAYPVYGLVLAILLSLFPGPEFHDGTIHNKLIAGHRRGTVYLSQAITAAAAAVLLQLVYLVVTAAVFLPLVGHGKMTAGFPLDGWSVALPLLSCLLAGVAYAAIFTMVSMILTNRSAAAVLCLVLLMGGFVLGLNAISLDGTSFQNSLVFYTDQSGALHEYRPLYASTLEGLWTILKVLVRALPTTQCVEINRGIYGTPNYLSLFPLLSLGTTAVCTGVGLAVFRRKDLQ